MHVQDIAHIEELCERLTFNPAARAILPPPLAALLEEVLLYEPTYLEAFDVWIGTGTEEPTARRIQARWAETRDEAGRRKTTFAIAYNQWTATLDPQTVCRCCGYYALGGLCAECAAQSGRTPEEEAAPWTQP